MRLGQLARSLDITTKEIVDYLSEKGIEAKSHPNSKLSEQNEEEVIAHFSQPEKANSIQELLDTPTTEIKDNSLEESEIEVKKENEDAITEVIETPEVLNTEYEENSDEQHTEVSDDKADLENIPEDSSDDQVGGESYAEVEIIKAPKIELPGLKVVGKIDLPEPKVKEEESNESEESAPEENANSTEENTPEVRYYKPDRKKKKPRKPREPLTEEQKEARRLKQKKEREKRQRRKEEQEKERLERQIKEKKKQHYEQKLKSASNGKKPKKNKAASKSKPNIKASKNNQDQPKTILGKFWKWLNT